MSDLELLSDINVDDAGFSEFATKNRTHLTSISRLNIAGIVNLIIFFLGMSLSIAILIKQTQRGPLVDFCIMVMSCFVGGMANFFIILFMSNQYSCVPGSGSIQKAARRIKKSIASTLLIYITPFPDQQEFYIENVRNVIEYLAVPSKIKEFTNSPTFTKNVRKLVSSCLSGVSSSYLNKDVNMDEACNAFKTIFSDYLTFYAPKLIAASLSSDMFSADKFHSLVKQHVTTSVNRIPDERIAEVVVRTFDRPFSFMVYFGNVSGIISGAFLAYFIDYSTIFDGID